MKIISCENFDEMSERASSLVFKSIQHKKDLLMCAATGNSPTGLYSKLVDKIRKDWPLSKKLRVVKLDEWGGVPENHEVTCERYLRTHLLNPLEISDDRYISFKSDPINPNSECERIQEELAREGPIDICILGIGKNGHIGFNEPNESLQPFCHNAELTNESLSHSMIKYKDVKPSYGLTLGMSDILNSGMIILLITGKEKKNVTELLLEKKIRTVLPASFLWLHPNVKCLIDKSQV